jgi:DNA-binding CsgD family transcriptional regulator
MSISGTIGEALLANRISYLGSVFLPFSMLMTIFNLSKLKYKKWIPVFLFIVTTAIFFIAASYPYLDIYYKSATLERVNGMSVLVKEYGPWHQVYLYYLVSYFLVMIYVTLHAVISKKIKSGIQSAIILIAVFVNICVWLFEQLVDMNFEFLSVSYIISELFLLSLYLLIQEHEKLLDVSGQAASVQKEVSSDGVSDNSEAAEKCRYIKDNLHTLTPTERSIYDCYLAGKGTKEVMKELNITENTLKFHNKNIYSKLGVSSRKELLEYVTIL